MKNICLGILLAVSFVKASAETNDSQFSESDFNTVYRLAIDAKKLNETPCPHEILRRPDSLEFILVLHNKSKVRLGLTADGSNKDSRPVWESVTGYRLRGGIDVFQMSSVQIFITKDPIKQKVSESYRGQFLLPDAKSDVGAKQSIQITGPNSIQYKAQFFRIGVQTGKLGFPSREVRGRVISSMKCVYRN